MPLAVKGCRVSGFLHSLNNASFWELYACNDARSDFTEIVSSGIDVSSFRRLGPVKAAGRLTARLLGFGNILLVIFGFVKEMAAAESRVVGAEKACLLGLFRCPAFVIVQWSRPS